MKNLTPKNGVKFLDDKIAEFGSCVVDFKFLNGSWLPTYILDDENILSVDGLEFGSCALVAQAMIEWHVADRDDEREIEMRGFDSGTTDNNLNPFSIHIKCLNKTNTIH